jgi:hypothetical protein
MSLLSWMTRPISEEEGAARTQRGFRAAVIALWAATVVSMLAGVHFWTAKDYDGFVLTWFALFGLALTNGLVSTAMLSVYWPSNRAFFSLSTLLSVGLCVASGVAVFKVPAGAAEQFDGSLVKRTSRPE